MKTEARKAYEHNMPCSEMLIRREIDRAKRGIKYSKLWLSRYKGALRSDHTFTSKDVEYVEKCISRCLNTIKGYKRLIQILKNGLPQRRPKGVIAKCLFCGAKANELAVMKLGDIIATGPALVAYEDKRHEKVVVECNVCGISKAMKSTLYTVQDAINAWNRRAQ